MTAIRRRLRLDLSSWLADLRFGSRVLWRERSFTAAAIVTLALAMGMGNTVYTVVNAMVLRGLPVAHPGRIVQFIDRGPQSFLLNFSYRDIQDLRQRTCSFAEIALFTNTTFIVGDEGRAADAVSGSYVSANIFRVVEQAPLVGRDFLPADEQPGAAPVAIIGYTVWASRYDADPAIVGRAIRINDTPTTVIGVMPAGFRFPVIDDLWVPVTAMAALQREARDARPFRACGRLADGVSMTRAGAELAAVDGQLAREYPTTNRTFRAAVVPYTGRVSQPMYFALLGAVASLLLIACANVSNLLLGRAAARNQEVAVRIALGASRWRVIRQFLTESAILAALAGACGYVLSLAGVKTFAYSVEGINFPYWYRDRWTMDHRVFVFMCGVCAASALVFGAAPALQLARRDVNDRLKQDRRTAGGGPHRWANALLAAEITLALMLLMAAGLMVKSFLAEYRADMAADAASVVTASFRPPPAHVATPAARLALYARIEQGLRAQPGLLGATFASAPPFIGAPLYAITLGAQRPRLDDPSRRASFVTIDPGYFDALGVTLLRGRPFTAEDGLAGHEAVVVNRQFVDIFFAHRDPMGQRVCATSLETRSATSLCGAIVGVSPTVRQQFMADLDPVIYVPMRANPVPAMLMFRSGNAGAAIAAVRAALQQAEPDAIVWHFTPLETWMQQSRWGYRVFGTMFSVFAVIALVLAAVGIYAVTAYAVVERTREVGIRLALGARARSVVLLFLGRTIMPLAVGLGLGLAGAVGVGRLVRGFLVHTGPADPPTLGGLAALLAFVATCAVVIPARRAARFEPSTALRHE